MLLDDAGVPDAMEVALAPALSVDIAAAAVVLVGGGWLPSPFQP
jgi:hypothetical protein